MLKNKPPDWEKETVLDGSLIEDSQKNKQSTLEKSNYFGMGAEGKKYWDQLQSGKNESNPEPKFKKR